MIKQILQILLSGLCIPLLVHGTETRMLEEAGVPEISSQTIDTESGLPEAKNPGTEPYLQRMEDKKIKKRFFHCTGYINGKLFVDSRQTVGTTEDQTVFFPEPKLETPTGDVFGRAHTQILPFETRLRIIMQEPRDNVWVNSKGVIEVEFKGSQDFVNLVNMRHAFGQLDWENSTFIFGQTWHALNVDELIPNTVSFNSGRPFAVYNRSPQLRYTYHAPALDIILYAGSQVDFPSDGPIGPSTTYIRNALIPNLDFQLKGFFGEHVIGTGVDYQRLAPRLVSDKGYKVHETISSTTGIWYLGLNWPKLQIKNTIMFGSNLSNYGILGGYAVEAHTTNPVTGQRKYTNLRTLTAWSDITVFPFARLEAGVFIGIEKNYGSAHPIVVGAVDPSGNIVTTIYGLGNDIDTVFRISPRIRVNIKQLTFAGEIEYTRAGYGDVTRHGTIKNINPVGNTQFLFSTFLYF